MSAEPLANKATILLTGWRGRLTDLALPTFIAVVAAGWLQHLYTCFSDRLWGFLIAGAIFVPIGVIHGWGVWLRLW